MNGFFLLDQIDGYIMINENFENGDFSSLKLIVKRYYKKVTEDVVKAKPRKPDLKNLIRQFKVGMFVPIKKNRFDHTNHCRRMDRVLTQEMRPTNLFFLEEAIENEDLHELIETQKNRHGTTG